MTILSKLLCRILPVDWIQPLLSEDGEYGVDELAVKVSAPGVVLFGSAWQAFSKIGGGSPYVLGGTNTTPWDMIFYIATKKQLSITGFSLYFNKTGSDATNFYRATITLYGSNDNSSWEQIASASASGTTSIYGSEFSHSFQNNKYYKYHKLNLYNPGVTKQDAMAIGGIRLTAKYEDFI